LIGQVTTAVASGSVDEPRGVQSAEQSAELSSEAACLLKLLKMLKMLNGAERVEGSRRSLEASFVSAL